MPTYKTRGIVLRRHNLGEADRIITFFTPDQGKVRGVARGVRRARSRMSGHLELFSDTELMLATGRNLDVLTSARMLRHYDGISQSFEGVTYGYLFVEMLDKLTQDNHEHPGLYELMQECLAELAAGRAGGLLELYFKLRLLAGLGYEPQLGECSMCHGAAPGAEYFFNAEMGGIVDGKCRDAACAAMDKNQIKLWRLLLVQPVERMRQVAGSGPAADASIAVCDGFYEHLFGKRFRSKGLLASTS